MTDSPHDARTEHHSPEESAVLLRTELDACRTEIARLRGRLEDAGAAVEWLAHKPCPNGCGCRTENDPDRRDCACAGACCMGEWPVKYPNLPPYIESLLAENADA